ncbi:MAG TPA: hypothetical protein VK897_08895 [Anaerolineales bacterium]|nr:hypothetical protein [Anaerolineales bacterium]
MTALRKKIPPLDEILAVYGTIVFLIYGWASITFSWKVPSWLYYLSLAEITAILSYTLASSLLECTIILLLLLLLAFLLPSKWLVDKFVTRASIIVYLLTFWVALFNLSTLIQLPTSRDLIFFGGIAILTIGMAIVIADRILPFQRLMTALGNRLIVFLYFWLPLSALGILIILVRIL